MLAVLEELEKLNKETVTKFVHKAYKIEKMHMYADNMIDAEYYAIP